MRTREVPVNNSKLKQGQILPFQILRKINLDQNEPFWVLRDPLGFKILLCAVYYQQYGFEPGKEILCRIDKINCNGKIFLEPRHPYYEEGKAYEFPIEGQEKRVNFLGEQEFFLMVRDIFGNLLKVSSAFPLANISQSNMICCYVDRIKKGRLFLRAKGVEQPGTFLNSGEWYNFRLTEEKKHPEDGNTYYILKGPDDKKYLLKKKPYLHYNLKIGQTIICRVDYFSAESIYKLQPKHPCYDLEKEYVFDVIRLDELVYADGSREKVLILEDCFGDEVKVSVEKNFHLNRISLKKVKAKVINFRKSRPELELTRIFF